MFRLGGTRGKTVPPAYPQREASRRQKYSTKRRYAREKEDFFADWQSAEDEEARAYCGRLRGADVQMVFERNKNTRRNGRRQKTISRGTTNGALTRGAGDKEHITKTYRQGCRYVIAG